MRPRLTPASHMILAVVCAGCAAGRSSSRVVRAPGSVPVRPLDVVALRSPYQGLVLAAGGAGRAAPIALVPGGGRREVARGVWVEVRPAGGHGASSVRRSPDLAAAELAALGTLAVAPGEVTIRLLGERNAPPPGTAQLAVAVLAALVGARFDATSVVVAELARDGTLAPVDDPVGAIDQALRAGARRIVLPLGGRFARDVDAAPVDLVARCRRAGAKVALAGDLPQALRVLAAVNMPKAQPLSRAAMQLDESEVAVLAAAYRSTLREMSESWPRIAELGVHARAVPPIAANVDAAVRGGRHAESLRLGGAVAAALAVIDRAAFHADAAVRIDELIVGASTSSTLEAGLRASLTAPADPVIRSSSQGTFDAALRAALAARDRARTAAWTSLAAGRTTIAIAALARYGELPEERRAGRRASGVLAESIAPALIAAARARHAARFAAVLRALDGGGLDVRFDAQRLAALSRLLQERAAPAALPSSPDLDRWTGEPRPHPVRRSELQALRLADLAARRWAAQAQTATGIVPAGARVRFEAAAALASGGARERALALELYRAASADCRVAVLTALAVAQRSPRTQTQ